MRRRHYLVGLSGVATSALTGCIASGQSGQADSREYTNLEPIPDDIEFGWVEQTPADPVTSLSINVDYQRPQASIDLYPDVAEYDQVYRPRPGQMFVIVVFKLSHTEGAAISDAENLLLLQTDDVSHQPVTFEDHENPIDEDLEPVLTGKRIERGAEFTGWLAYSVPRDFDMARVAVNDSFGPGDIEVRFHGRKITGVEDAYAPPPAE